MTVLLFSELSPHSLNPSERWRIRAGPAPLQFWSVQSSVAITSWYRHAFHLPQFSACIFFFFSIHRTAGLWQVLPVSWLSTKAILLIFQPTAFEWLAPCLWTCSLFNSKCIILNFFLLNCIQSMSHYFSWSALPSRTTVACRDLSVCDTSGFGCFVACFAFSVDQCISQITLNYTAIKKIISKSQWLKTRVLSSLFHSYYISYTGHQRDSDHQSHSMVQVGPFCFATTSTQGF